jgi:hypothetical protein
MMTGTYCLVSISRELIKQKVLVMAPTSELPANRPIPRSLITTLRRPSPPSSRIRTRTPSGKAISSAHHIPDYSSTRQMNISLNNLSRHSTHPSRCLVNPLALRSHQARSHQATISSTRIFPPTMATILYRYQTSRCMRLRCRGRATPSPLPINQVVRGAQVEYSLILDMADRAPPLPHPSPRSMRTAKRLRLLSTHFVQHLRRSRQHVFRRI